MSGFENQTYTQVPNSLFNVMSDMDECELKVVLYICRFTFGYHRDEIKISTRKLAAAIKMSVASVDKGADAAVNRGLIERITDGQSTTLWRAIVSDSDNESPVTQKMNRSDSKNESQLGVKERINKLKEIEDEGETQSIFTVYENEIGMITPIIADSLEDWEKSVGPKWVCDAIHESAIQNKRGWKYCLAILERWKAQGSQEPMKKPARTNSKASPADDGWLAQKEMELQHVRTA